MKLYTYLRLRHYVEDAETVILAEQARRMAEQILQESAACPGMYPTVSTMWNELLRRAKKLEEQDVNQA